MNSLVCGIIFILNVIPEEREPISVQASDLEFKDQDLEMYEWTDSVAVGLAVYPRCRLFPCILEVVVMTTCLFFVFFFFKLGQKLLLKNIEEALFSRWKMKQSVMLPASVDEANNTVFLFANLILQGTTCLLVRWTDVEKLVNKTGKEKHRKRCHRVFISPSLFQQALTPSYGTSLYVCLLRFVSVVFEKSFVQPLGKW